MKSKLFYIISVALFLMSININAALPINLDKNIPDRFIFAKTFMYSTNLVVNGISFSSDEPALAGYLTLVDTKSNLYATLGLATISLNAANKIVDAYLGYKKSLTPSLTLDLGFQYWDAYVPKMYRNQNVKRFGNNILMFYVKPSYVIKNIGEIGFDLQYSLTKKENTNLWKKILFGSLPDAEAAVMAKAAGTDYFFNAKFKAAATQTQFNYHIWENENWGNTLQIDQPLFTFKGINGSVHWKTTENKLFTPDIDDRAWLSLTFQVF